MLDTVDENADIFPRYRDYEKRFPEREILFIHGSRVDPDVRVINRFGAKVCRDCDWDTRRVAVRDAGRFAR